MQLPVREPKTNVHSHPVTTTSGTASNPRLIRNARLFTAAVSSSTVTSTLQPSFVPSAVPKVTPMSVLLHTVQDKGVIALWTGVWPAIYGNAAKAGIRFMFYDNISRLLAGSDGKLGMSGTLAGKYLTHILISKIGPDVIL